MRFRDRSPDRRPFPGVADEFRRLGSELQMAFGSAPSLLVTGPSGGEGTTTVAVQLVAALAENSKSKVLLVDGNVRNPMVHQFFGLSISPGVADWDGVSAPPCRRSSETPNLFVLTAGSAEGKAAPWVEQGKSLGELVKQIRDNFDFIVWDAPPLGRYPDALVLATVVDGVLAVVEADRTTADELTQVREQLARVGARLLGAVVNRHGRFMPPGMRNTYGG